MYGQPSAQVFAIGNMHTVVARLGAHSFFMDTRNFTGLIKFRVLEALRLGDGHIGPDGRSRVSCAISRFRDETRDLAKKNY